MAHKAGPAKPLISTKVAVWGLVIGLAFMFGSLIVSNGASKTNGDSKTPKQPIVKVIEVDVPLTFPPIKRRLRQRENHH